MRQRPIGMGEFYTDELGVNLFGSKGKKSSRSERRLKALSSDELDSQLSKEEMQNLMQTAEEILAKSKELLAKTGKSAKGQPMAVSLEAQMDGDPMDKRIDDRMKMRRMLELEEAGRGRELRPSDLGDEDMKHEHPVTGRTDEDEFDFRVDQRKEMGGMGDEDLDEESRIDRREKERRKLRGR